MNIGVFTYIINTNDINIGALIQYFNDLRHFLKMLWGPVLERSNGVKSFYHFQIHLHMNSE